MLQKPTLSLMRTGNFISAIIILFLILECIRQKMEIKITVCSKNFSSHNESNEALPTSLNLKRIKEYYLKKGDLFIPSGLKRKDWHNYTQIELEKQSLGTTDQRKPADLFKGNQSWERKLFLKYSGYNVALSDEIPLNRSLPDVRDPKCKKRLYLESLPKVSVIIAFRNERWSSVMRTLYSVINRAPKNLLKEIFLVDDASDEDYLKENFDKYIEENMPKVQVVHLKNHSGLVAARLAGVKAATGDVLVFLDSHIEANVNWLPPLLEPIALDYRTVVIPIVDIISYVDFNYYSKDEGARGIFDWTFIYYRLTLAPKDLNNLPEPFETPIMTGGLFAISRAFFWELGGYDTGLHNWGCDEFQLSFKIWQCGGRLLEAPCSRIGHRQRALNYPGHDTYVLRNMRRVAEVWMDEYAEYLYARIPEINDVDPGDLTDQLALREKLKCKPFKWYMTQVAYDLTQRFPAVDPKSYAEGRIRPKVSPHLCVDGNNGAIWDLFVLNPCHPADLKLSPKEDDQLFMLTRFNDVQLQSRFICWDLETWYPGTYIRLYECHRRGENQQWRYYQDLKRFVFIGCSFSVCLDHNPQNRELFLSLCDDESETQLWEIDTVHDEEMAKWSVLTALRVTGPVEEWKEQD